MCVAGAGTRPALPQYCHGAPGAQVRSLLGNATDDSFNTPSTSRLQNLVEVRFVASALGPQFCLHYNSALVWLKKTWLAGRIAPFALLVVELCPVAYRATAGANFVAFPTYQQRLHWLRAPNNTCLSRPDPPTLSLRRLGDPDHRPARQDGAGTAGDGRGTAERDRKSAAASGGSPEAPAGTLHTQIWARPTQPKPRQSCAAGLPHLRPTSTQSDARGRARGRWAGGRLIGQLEQQWAAGPDVPPAGRCARERASAGAWAGGDGSVRRPVSSGKAPRPSSSAWEQPMSAGACWGGAGE